jgi:small subunit ribosomal protein S4e
MSKHLKRLAAPRALKIERKERKWTIRPSCGPHPVDRSIPLGIIVRDYLKLCDKASEAKKIVGKGEILIDGTPRKDIKFPCGLMDVISIPKLKKHYRVSIDKRGKLTLVPISENEAKWKFCRIENKTTLKGKKTQLNLHDGRNILVDKDTYKTNDTLKISIPDQKILDVFPFKEGTTSMIIGGTHIGEIATIDKIEITRSSMPNIVHLKNKDEKFQTIKNYVFPIGKDKPELTIPGVKIE